MLFIQNTRITPKSKGSCYRSPKRLTDSRTATLPIPCKSVCRRPTPPHPLTPGGWPGLPQVLVFLATALQAQQAPWTPRALAHPLMPHAGRRRAATASLCLLRRGLPLVARMRVLGFCTLQ